ncbi:MAG: hypothetical protein PVF28_04560 [Thioalkalispiraceae bacterium]|jgi:hypothetical protein
MNLWCTSLLRTLLFSLLLSGSLVSMAAGDMTTITHGKQRIVIHYAASLSTTERASVYRWLQQASTALHSVYGEWPLDVFNIDIQRANSGAGPVPWGQVARGTPTRVLLVVNPRLGYEVMLRDWTVFHELSHLFLPYRGYGNIWLSEGLATYYQNVIQARHGLISETEMWRRLANGFARGRNEQDWQALTLTQVSDQLHETRQYMRVHWSGVLYWLNIDIALRQSGKATLDSVLKQLRDCCAGQSMSSREIVHKLDDLAETDLFVPLFKQYCDTRRTPEYNVLLNELGVRQPSPGSLTFNTQAALSSIRHAISQPVH